MVQRQEFGDKQALATALANTISDALVAGIKSRGEGSLAVSGGSTPAKLLEALSQHENVDWSKVVVTLVDERWVDETSDRSNGRLVRNTLIQNAATNARFVPLYGGGDTPDQKRIDEVNVALAGVPSPFDAVILGMGNDGHTASFFPGGDTLDQVLANPGPAMTLNAAGAGEPRITLTLPHLLKTNNLIIHIEGDEKLATLERALGDGEIADMPVRAVLRQSVSPVQIYWCP